MSEHTVIIDPSARVTTSVAGPNRLSGDLRGKVVGVIDNTKPNFDVLAEEMAELLVREYGVSAIVSHRKRFPSTPATEAMMRELQDKCDLVITGSGD